MEKHLLIGCIADDFTGASDAASFLAKAGLRTMLQNGVQENASASDCDAVVIGLKTRSIAPELAVKESLRALEWLNEQGAQQIYFKYCSTFDSTPKGNIGPVVDALMEELDAKAVILCPSLPVNGRTVKDGILYVNGVPLAESPMKDHPINPMWASDLGELMEPQGKYKTLKMDIKLLSEGKEAVNKALDEFGEGKEHFYIIPDYYEDSQAEILADVFGDMKLLSGGSGILTAWAGKLAGGIGNAGKLSTATEGPALLLAGSCSVATREQIRVYAENGGHTVKIDPLGLISGEQTMEQIWEEAGGPEGQEVLIYSSDSPEEVSYVQEIAGDKASEILESTMAKLAQYGKDAGYTRFIVAGGETSGAVSASLGYNTYLIGESIAPGVPVMIPEGNRQMRIVLKSGNFGQPDFFIRAVDMTGEEINK